MRRGIKRRIRSAVCACALLAGSTFAAQAQSPFTAVYGFGDSYADIGNLFRITHTSSPVYPTGRFSGGTNSTYRDFVTPGVASSGVWNPPKPVVRSLWHLQDSINNAGSFSVTAYGALGDGSADDAPAFNAAVAAAQAAGGGVITVPVTTSFYKLNSTLVVPQGVSVQCSDNAIIKPGAAMTDLATITANIGTRFAGCTLGNQSGFASNGVSLVPVVAGNNFNVIEGNIIVGFVNGIWNTNSDIFTIKNNWLQGNSGCDIISADNGTGSLIDGNQSLGSGCGIRYAKTTRNVEGVKIVNNNILATGGKGVRFSGGLKITIAHNVFDQLNDTAIELDGNTGYPIADFTIDDNWGGPKDSPTNNFAGLDIFGNAVDIRVTNSTFNGFSNCGIRMRTTVAGTPQRISIDGTRLVNNGTGAGSADLCTDTTAGGMGPIVVTKSWFESTGGSVKSIIEGAGTLGIYRDNRFFSGLTKSATSYYDHNFGDDTDPSTGAYTVTQKGIHITADGSIANLGNDLNNTGTAFQADATLGRNNFVTAIGSSSGGNPVLLARGSDANLDLGLQGKGIGVPRVLGGTYCVSGATSGQVCFAVPSIAGSNTIKWPAGTIDFSITGGASQVLKQTSAGGPFTVARLACADLSNAGSACPKNTGTSVADPGTGNLEALLPVQTITGASRTFVAADLYQETRRSNSGSAMTDTFPGSATAGLVNGTMIQFNNVDATANVTISAGAGTTINSGSSVVVGPGRSTKWAYDAPATNWRPTMNSLTSLLAANNLSEVVTPATARANLGAAASARAITAGSGLTGGGDLSADRTISVATNGITRAMQAQVTAATLTGNPTGSTANLQDVTLGSTLAFVGSALQTVAHTGDCTTPANSFVLTCTKINGNDLDGAWTTWAPSATCNGTAVDGTAGSVVTYAKYKDIGHHTVLFNINFTCRTTAGTGAVLFNLPHTAAGSGAANGREVTVTGTMASGAFASGDTNVALAVSSSGANTWAQGSHFVISGQMEF
jgi:hypothetical protein